MSPRHDLHEEGVRLLDRLRRASVAAIYRATHTPTPAALERLIRMSGADHVAAAYAARNAELNRRMATPMRRARAHDGTPFDDPAAAYAAWCRTAGREPLPASLDWAKYKPFQKVTRMVDPDMPAFLRRPRAPSISRAAPPAETVEAVPVPVPAVVPVPAAPLPAPSRALVPVPVPVPVPGWLEIMRAALKVPVPVPVRVPALPAPPPAPLPVALLSAPDPTPEELAAGRAELGLPAVPVPVRSRTVRRSAEYLAGVAAAKAEQRAKRQNPDYLAGVAAGRAKQRAASSPAKVIHIISKGKVRTLHLPAGF